MTHCDRLLRVLSDGRLHDHRELYRLGMIVHSRVADLRKRGHVIEHERRDGTSWYRLLDEPSGSLPSHEETRPGGSSSCAGVGHGQSETEGGDDSELELHRVVSDIQPQLFEMPTAPVWR